MLEQIELYHTQSDLRKNKQGYHDEQAISEIFKSSKKLFSTSTYQGCQKEKVDMIYEIKKEVIFELCNHRVDIAYLWEPRDIFKDELHQNFHCFLDELFQANYEQAKIYLTKFISVFSSSRQISHIYNRTVQQILSSLLLDYKEEYL